MKEQIIKIAEYDYWKRFSAESIYWVDGVKISSLDNFKYATSFDALIPVAKRVCDELQGKSENAIRDISYSVLTFDIQPLFAAVCSGIDIINASKTQNKL